MPNQRVLLKDMVANERLVTPRAATAAADAHEIALENIWQRTGLNQRLMDDTSLFGLTDAHIDFAAVVNDDLSSLLFDDGVDNLFAAQSGASPSNGGRQELLSPSRFANFSDLLPMPSEDAIGQYTAAASVGTAGLVPFHTVAPKQPVVAAKHATLPPSDACALCGAAASPSNPLSIGKRRELAGKWAAIREDFLKIRCGADKTRHWTCRQEYRAAFPAFADRISAETSAHCYPVEVVDGIFEEPFPQCHKRCMSGLSLLIRMFVDARCATALAVMPVNLLCRGGCDKPVCEACLAHCHCCWICRMLCSGVTVTPSYISIPKAASGGSVGKRGAAIAGAVTVDAELCCCRHIPFPACASRAVTSPPPSTAVIQAPEESVLPTSQDICYPVAMHAAPPVTTSLPAPAPALMMHPVVLPLPTAPVLTSPLQSLDAASLAWQQYAAAMSMFAAATTVAKVAAPPTMLPAYAASPASTGTPIRAPVHTPSASAVAAAAAAVDAPDNPSKHGRSEDAGAAKKAQQREFLEFLVSDVFCDRVPRERVNEFRRVLHKNFRCHAVLTAVLC